jgi:hypothetical protein
MKTEKITIENYTKQVKLGYIEQVKCLSIFNKIAKRFTDCKGNFELVEFTFKH